MCIIDLRQLYIYYMVGALISKALKEGFVGIRLPQIRHLILPGYCHEIVKCCPGVAKIWCIRDDGWKLITAIAKNCKEVEELRGFQTDEKMMKSKN